MVDVRRYIRKGRPVSEHSRRAPRTYGPKDSPRSSLHDLLASFDFGVLSASKTEFFDSTNEFYTNLLMADLRAMGYNPERAMGHYLYTSGPNKGKASSERAVFVPGLGRTDALRLGRKYRQESVLVRGNLIGSQFDNNGDVLMRFDREKTLYGARARKQAYYTTVRNTTFSLQG